MVKATRLFLMNHGWTYPQSPPAPFHKMESVAAMEMNEGSPSSTRDPQPIRTAEYHVRNSQISDCK
ncbi:hypothetical protein COCON_G00125050 [Conger conger]|uniref:Uncharacterized protein n=1 Tax=Conger conger TaxID=82655 RepID=A0A9Q1DCT5_CONCO|nr:hypothetical protein COCON_G00125050 [Conger conger]